eukprot:CAMPEP_0182828818 /NCGR_PEP_ID=MMETSP0006_2-20121128/17682_1 /TAXON_ID=97485 /ORGANISM="Prymnesium parvum, Strain Texoma1" /LENGTH=60 /DNA_ID=CAMNT_0024956219 /DNA_START=348 /DNA_END=526 /DNA_ORIENTATION=-
MYLCTQRSTHVASPTESSCSLYAATHFLKHCSVILLNISVIASSSFCCACCIATAKAIPP